MSDFVRGAFRCPGPDFYPLPFIRAICCRDDRFRLGPALAKQVGPGHPVTAADAFQHVEADLAGGIRADGASFTASASRGDDALGGLAAGMGIASLLMAAGSAWGLTRRIAEYR
jgi:hypothetical protein